MSTAEYDAFDEKWSHEHDGQHFNRPPLLPYHDGNTLVDMLHAFINDTNDALLEAFHSHLSEEHSDKQLKDLQAHVRGAVNRKLKAWAEEGGASLALQFGLPGKLHIVNGPKLKALFRHPKLLAELIEEMKPLYTLMESKDHPLTRRVDLRNAFEAVADTVSATRIAADLTAAATGAQTSAPGKRGHKKQSGRGAHLNKKQRPVIMPGAGAGAGAAAQQEANDTARDADTPGNTQGHIPSTTATCAADNAETYLETVSYMMLALTELWTFLHQNELDSSKIGPEMRASRAAVAEKLALELEGAILSCVGTKRRRTYAHDMVYGLRKLYMLYGKPWMGSTEGNEHAHQEMKGMFRHMCGKSSKRRGAILQLMDLGASKRILVNEVAGELPRQAYTATLTGLQVGAGHKERARKRSDLTIEDSKDALAKTANIRHCRAPCESMDLEWNEVVGKRLHVD